MAERFILSQSAPAATTLTDLYAVPSPRRAVIANLTVCNRGVAGTLRISIAPSGEADAVKHYRRYDLAIPAADSYIITEGWALPTGAVIRVYASHANMSFSCDAVET